MSKNNSYHYGVLLAGVFLLSSCASSPAPDFAGRWKPVNRFSKTVTEIPLYSSYVYQATPVDATLKGMLERWAKDTQMELDYSLTSDYTLSEPVAKLATTSLQQAAEEVSSIYSAEGVAISVAGNKIIAQPRVTSSVPAQAATAAEKSSNDQT